MQDGPTRARAPSTITRYTKVRVTVTRGPDKGTTAEAAGAPVRIGTAPDNDLVLLDDTVSRHHCELEVTDEGVRLRDRGSTNGIVAGKVRVFDAVLPQETRLRIGDTELSVVAVGEVIERVRVSSDRFGDVLGRSPRMRELFADLERIAASDVTVLIQGETGTGKDLVAESIHRTSDRANRPFVVFDCSAVSPSLVESELFGHERGAFTGATAARAGVFEQAHGGTLFIDEIGELPKELQPKLLRVLEKREVRRVGGSSVRAVDVRVLAATNRNLRAEVQRATFREDLYFRLSTTDVRVPPLRDRMDDLPFLLEHFLALEGSTISAKDLPPHVYDLFAAYRWPGNVRELRNAVRRLIVTPDRVLGEGVSNVAASPADAASVAPLRAARREAADAFERNYLGRVLAAANGNVTRAAGLADVSRQMMQKLLRKHGRADE